MGHPLRSFGLALVALLALGSPALAEDVPRPLAQEPYGQGILFRLDRQGIAPSFVFGTLHSSDPRVTAIPAAVRRAFDAARTFAPETVLTERDLDEFFAAAQFDDGRRLEDFFDAGTVAAIRIALGGAALSEGAFVRLKPWAVLLKLAERPRRSDEGASLDALLLAEARWRGLAVVGLELPDEQVSALDAIPLATQVALVQFLLTHREQLVRDHDAIVAAWLDRDLARLVAIGDTPARTYPAIAPHFAELARHIVENRSAQMAHRLFVPLRRGRVFVAVGALHLYGKRSLLALLRDQGYAVRRVY
jgi:uncharacterized protein YbaP (TraB family)